jgi:GPI-anchor transamidase subunit T
LNVPPEREVLVDTTLGHAESKHDDGFVRCYEIPAGVDFDLRLPEQVVGTKTPLARPPLYAARSINGHGQEHGSVRAVITNPSATDTVDIVYLESLPWYMKPYLHTLRATISPSIPGIGSPIKETYYRPSVDRHRGTHLELLASIPPASTLTLTYDFEKAILRYTEYPPDANRGFDVAPAVIRLVSDSEKSSGRGTYLRTTSLLLPLPTPDFSMPYNVIILTSTVMALGFGSIFNILIRRFVAADEVEDWKVKAGGLKGIIRGRMARLRAKFSGKGAKTE